MMKARIKKRCDQRTMPSPHLSASGMLMTAPVKNPFDRHHQQAENLESEDGGNGQYKRTPRSRIRPQN
jgi:hypothetical protein